MQSIYIFSKYRYITLAISCKKMLNVDGQHHDSRQSSMQLLGHLVEGMKYDSIYGTYIEHSIGAVHSVNYGSYYES